VSLFVNGWVQGEIDRRLDVNNNGRLETGPPNDPATGLPISNWDDDDLSLFTKEFVGLYQWRLANDPTTPDPTTALFDGTGTDADGIARGKLSREDIDNRIGAAGMWWDPHLGIYHVRHRAYDPRLGRFLQPDPIGVAGGWNVFEYVGGDPANFVDPLGLAGWGFFDGWGETWDAFSNEMTGGQGFVHANLQGIHALFSDGGADFREQAVQQLADAAVNAAVNDQRATGAAVTEGAVTTTLLSNVLGFEDLAAGVHGVDLRASPEGPVRIEGAERTGALLRGVGSTVLLAAPAVPARANVSITARPAVPRTTTPAAPAGPGIPTTAPAAPACGTGAANVAAHARYVNSLRVAESASEKSVSVRTLPDGRIRFYEAEKLAKKAGPTRGASHVTEYNPKTGRTRSWIESYDQNGNVIRVHPKSIDGDQIDLPHYPPTGRELQGPRP
jgi:RHS repeat-associated protein